MTNMAQRPDAPLPGQEFLIDGYAVTAQSYESHPGQTWYYVRGQPREGELHVDGIVCFGPDWNKICHYRGWWPDREELLRRPLSWTATLPDLYDEMSALEVAAYYLTRRDALADSERRGCVLPVPAACPAVQEATRETTAQGSLFDA